jgi:outer membrane protein TolC
MHELRLTIALLCGLATASAGAQQPLDAFVRAAADRALDARSARVDVGEARSRVDEARAALLPSLTLSGGYTRNQLEVVAEFGSPGDLQRAVISAQDQVDGRLQLDVVLVDVSAWSRFFGAESTADAAAARAAGVQVAVNEAVVAGYYRLAAGRALLRSAVESLATARENLLVVQTRASAGLASELDLERARADVARVEQRAAEAQLEEVLAARQLVDLTGLEPEAGAIELEDDLAPEAPLARWLQAAPVPDLEAARLDLRAAEQAADAAWQELLPSLSAFAAERYSNAAGFGPEFLWSLGVNLRWTLDFGRPARMGTAQRARERAEIAFERAQQRSETGIHDAWHTVRARIQAATATRAALAASDRAAQVARARFAAGTGTQLEVSQAERDLLEARANRIRADADLATSRLTLRLRAGLPPERGASPS